MSASKLIAKISSACRRSSSKVVAAVVQATVVAAAVVVFVNAEYLKLAAVLAVRAGYW